jgi:hypothetical protein
MTFLSLLVTTTRSLAAMAIVSCALTGSQRPLAAADRLPAKAGGDILLTPIVHASVQVEYGTFLLQVDPWLVGNYGTDKLG